MDAKVSQSSHTVGTTVQGWWGNGKRYCYQAPGVEGGAHSNLWGGRCVCTADTPASEDSIPGSGQEIFRGKACTAGALTSK